jgi:hypothetical protein
MIQCAASTVLAQRTLQITRDGKGPFSTAAKKLSVATYNYSSTRFWPYHCDQAFFLCHTLQSRYKNETLLRDKSALHNVHVDYYPWAMLTHRTTSTAHFQIHYSSLGYSHLMPNRSMLFWDEIIVPVLS